jgi:FtsH-binding integral membrane protein
MWAFLFGQMLKPLVERLDDRDILFRTLVLTAGVFLGMVAVGFIDNQNLLGLGPYLFGALLGLIVAQIVLMAAKMTGAKGLQSVESAIPFFGVGLFSLFTAYDTQVLKERARMCRGVPDYVNESVRFLLDFVNLFANVANA